MYTTAGGASSASPSSSSSVSPQPSATAAATSGSASNTQRARAPMRLVRPMAALLLPRRRPATLLASIVRARAPRTEGRLHHLRRVAARRAALRPTTRTVGAPTARTHTRAVAYDRGDGRRGNRIGLWRGRGAAPDRGAPRRQPPRATARGPTRGRRSHRGRRLALPRPPRGATPQDGRPDPATLGPLDARAAVDAPSAARRGAPCGRPRRGADARHQEPRSPPAAGADRRARHRRRRSAVHGLVAAMASAHRVRGAVRRTYRLLRRQRADAARAPPPRCRGVVSRASRSTARCSTANERHGCSRSRRSCWRGRSTTRPSCGGCWRGG